MILDNLIVSQTTNLNPEENTESARKIMHSNKTPESLQ